eukprot:GILJ01012452.1.p1 GENE.GILJ01012452.1~~GILJ01012452.1.p1  ORF type:complete len:279 (+),score=30.38 GILJ01012452.1:34-870(+)
MSSLCTLAAQAMALTDATEKAAFSRQCAAMWRAGAVTEVGSENPPVKEQTLQEVDPTKVPKRGKAGTLENRIALIHSLAHIEAVAVDLSWDLICRFKRTDLPKEFYDDWVQVADDEARHYTTWADRLKELGSSYGSLAVHNGLWNSAENTDSDLLARLAVEHMVLEARGLDVAPLSLARLRSAGDTVSADLYQKIYEDEINHVATGVKWFTYLCEHAEPPKDPIATFHQLVRQYFRGNLKAPFNTEARTRAGMTEEWYLPLTSRDPPVATNQQEPSQS